LQGWNQNILPEYDPKVARRASNDRIWRLQNSPPAQQISRVRKQFSEDDSEDEEEDDGD
jgi:hypothetical protein